jgi:hypothetical protein
MLDGASPALRAGGEEMVGVIKTVVADYDITVWWSTTTWAGRQVAQIATVIDRGVIAEGPSR